MLEGQGEQERRNDGSEERKAEDEDREGRWREHVESVAGVRAGSRGEGRNDGIGCLIVTRPELRYSWA